MILAEIAFPDFDPVAFRVLGFPIRWYGLSYVLAFLVAGVLLKRLAKERIFPVPPERSGDILFDTMLGVILGGRLGYALIYKPGLYLTHPVELVRIWEGGLSFHGGLAGVIVAVLWFARRRKVSVARIMDACALAAPPGIFFVRMANFVNGELWGRPTDVPWAMVFPSREAGGVPRHPSQIYEGLLEGVLLFVLLWAVRRRPAFRPAGRLASLFVLGYGTVRFLAEFTREPDSFLGAVLGPFSMGQVLCAIMIAIGIWGWRRSGRAGAAESGPAGG